MDRVTVRQPSRQLIAGRHPDRDGAQLATLGVIAGGRASVGTGGLLTSLLFGVAPGDRATLGAVAAFVTGLAVIAAWLPARRAARIDPAEALRS